MELLKYVIPVVTQKELMKQYSEHPTTDATEINLLSAITNDPRYRGALQFFEEYRNQTLPVDKQKGLAYWVGLINAADDLTDSNQILLESQTPDTLRHQLLESTVVMGGQDVSIRDLLDRVYAAFPEHEMLINEALDSFSHTQLDSTGIPGTYGFNEAYQYRVDSTVAYAETTSCLIEAPSPALMEQCGRMSLLWQMVDDASDISEDAATNNKNMFIGVASEVNTQQLAALSEYATTQKQTIWQRKVLLRKFPEARKMYYEHFQALHSQLVFPKNKVKYCMQFLMHF